MVEELEDEIAVTEEPEEEEQDMLRYEISSYPSDMTLQVYYDKWADGKGQIVIPDFQRQYVWDQVQASKLIESFLIGIPVPGVFLYKEKKTNKLLVIDGQQRIYSIVQFIKGNFGEKVFRLKNVMKKWEGKTFSELDKSDQYQLQDAILRATIVQQLEPDDMTSVYHIFERLNSGGTKLSPMEIRKCVYSGPFYKFLEKTNNTKEWRQILGKTKPDKRLKDIELLLRILATGEKWESYEKPMKNFLNQYMSEHMDSSDETNEATGSIFINTCKFIIEQLGEKPFHFKGRLNLGLMDSVMTAMSKVPEDKKEQSRKNFDDLLSNDQFLKDITVSTSDTSVLKNRFRIAIKILCG